MWKLSSWRGEVDSQSRLRRSWGCFPLMTVAVPASYLMQSHRAAAQYGLPAALGDFNKQVAEFVDHFFDQVAFFQPSEGLGADLNWGLGGSRRHKLAKEAVGFPNKSSASHLRLWSRRSLKRIDHVDIEPSHV